MSLTYEPSSGTYSKAQIVELLLDEQYPIDRLWEGCRESRRCSRDTYPESYVTKYTSIRRSNHVGFQGLESRDTIPLLLLYSRYRS